MYRGAVAERSAEPAVQRVSVTRLLRAWTRLYTSLAPFDGRDRRRREVASDVFEQLADGTAPGPLLRRMARGLPNDVGWSLRSACEPGGAARRATTSASSSAIVLSVALW